MTRFPIDDYVDEVAAHLKLRGTARQQALADLRDALAEAADAVDDAIAIAGRAADYARSLDEEFGTTDGAFRTILGMPNSFGRGIGRRLAGTFDPADERLLVPRVFGAGWTLNMGAVAVRLGWLRPDDVDDELLAEASDDHLTGPRLVAAAATALAAASTALLHARRQQAEQASGKPQQTNLIFGVLMPLASTALIAASANQEVPGSQRLAMPGLAAALSLLTIGTNGQAALRPTGQTITLAAVLAAMPTQFLLSYLPVRAALHQSWSTQESSEK